jgi:hypothetical protein
VKRILSVLLTLLALSANGQEKSDKFAIYISGMDTAVPVVDALTKMMNASKPLKAVGPKDDNKLAVLVKCMDRKQTDPFVCMYVSHFSGASFQTFMGGGILAAGSADTIATNFLSAIAQDIVERYNDTDKNNLRQGLEACLLLTESKCNVPDPLQQEFDAKQLTLGQYLLKRQRQ